MGPVPPIMQLDGNYIQCLVCLHSLTLSHILNSLGYALATSKAAGANSRQKKKKKKDKQPLTLTV